jgi:RNA-directed DNA polymerase
LTLKEKHTLHTEGEKHMATQLERIAEVAKAKPKEKFTSLIHLINQETLIQSHKEMSGKKVAGVDEVTKEMYNERLEENVEELIGRMKRQAYKPQPARRVYIPKPGTDKKRPLGIPSYEDKLVQSTLARTLNAIYEQDFMECSFGFRPNRGCHDALKLLDKILNKSDIKYVVDADIRGFFDNVNHEWMMKFIAHRIEDPNIQRLISRMLKAGIIEAGIKYDTPQGTPQGGSLSPLLANVYLHYVIDLWFEKVVRGNCKGKAYMVRYADDTVFCFQYEEDAKKFYQEFIIRLGKFNLEIAEEKTKIIELKKDNNDEDDKGENSFDFLGFTHYVGKDKNGRKRVKRKTSKKKYKASLLRCKEWMKVNRITPIKQFMKIIKAKIQGHCNYYGITDNRRTVGNFIDEIRKLIFKWLNRRSQKKSFNWDKFILFLNKYPLPKAKVYVSIFDLGAGNSYIM